METNQSKNILLGIIAGGVMGYGVFVLLLLLLNKYIGSENLGGWSVVFFSSIIICAIIGAILAKYFFKLFKILLIIFVIALIGYVIYVYFTRDTTPIIIHSPDGQTVRF